MTQIERIKKVLDDCRQEAMGIEELLTSEHLARALIKSHVAPPVFVGQDVYIIDEDEIVPVQVIEISLGLDVNRQRNVIIEMAEDEGMGANWYWPDVEYYLTEEEAKAALKGGRRA